MATLALTLASRCDQCSSFVYSWPISFYLSSILLKTPVWAMALDPASQGTTML